MGDDKGGLGVLLGYFLLGVCHGVRRVLEKGFGGFLKSLKMVESCRGFLDGTGLANAKNSPEGFW